MSVSAPELSRRRAPAAAEWEIWTTTVRIVVEDPGTLTECTLLLREWLAAVEVVASRFRPDSEVCRLARSSATEHRISPLLHELVAAALTAAAASGGCVDPTVGSVLAHLDMPVAVPVFGAQPTVSTVRPTTWRDLDLGERILRMPPQTLLDLGATGKAFAADRAAELIADAVGCGVLVSLGGDLRVAGRAPEQGWTVLVQDRPGEPASLVDLGDARAIATSSTLRRRIGPARAHHVIDPLTLRPIEPVWRSVSVAADTCVTANTWSTAAMVRAGDGPAMLAATGLPARLVGADGRVVRLGRWPA